ncbi:MAG: hypothetical protein QG670_115 [Thermoproteota archaeon]|nr:hypothetical protein [Thermoproteota archaeon]
MLLEFLIDIPFLIVVVLSGGEPDLVLLLVLLIPLLISGLIVYSSYSAGRMNYVLEETDLKVNFPLSPLNINYNRIKSARKVETNLRFRLFGGSLPGNIHDEEPRDHSGLCDQVQWRIYTPRAI